MVGTATIVARLRPDGTRDVFDVHGLRAATTAPAFGLASLPSGSIVAAVGGDGPVRLVGLRGGTAMGRVGISRAGPRKVRLRCLGAPGCAGTVNGRPYALAHRATKRVRITGRRLRVTNPPQASQTYRLAN